MFVLASNHFWKCFSVNVGVWLRIKNKFSGNYFQLTMCFNGFNSEIGFSQNFHFKPFPDSRAKREREKERERPQSSDRAPVQRPQQRTPQTELQSDDHRPVSSHHATPAPIHTSTNQANINSNATRSRLRHTISSSHPLRDLASRSNSVTSLSSFFSQFDRIWWIFCSGFCFFCVSVLRNDIIYLFGSCENVSNK